MKKFLWLFCSICLGLGCLSSCSSDDEEKKISELENEYFSIENATYTGGAFPASTSGMTVDGISVNGKALTGGMNFITVVTEKTYKKFYVGVKDVDGYWTFVPETASARAGGYNTYSIPVLFSTKYARDIVILVSAVDETGDVTRAYEAQVDFVDSESGDIAINLIFNNDKDVDLHLIMPDETHIYYANRGGYLLDGNGVETDTYFGLDHDSNAGCDIDGMRNENIVVPAELVQDGTYRVVVDMYQNCDRSIPTTWSVVARYKGKLLDNETGERMNPVAGVYPEGAGNDDMTEVMTFTINNGKNRGVGRAASCRFKAVPPSDMDEMKKEEAAFRKGK